MNPTWVEPSAATGFKGGLLMRTQNCDATLGDGNFDTCVACGGSEDKASILTFSAYDEGIFTNVTESSVVFGPADDSDSWGTEDPRMAFDEANNLYYMFYTAYNGHDIFLSLATSQNPTSSADWTRHGPVFPD